ncbi:HNH endonuclease signature motif containing protein [Mycoavidus cysteinexigens]|nr:HNH endonuclease signature motif containing protein [Mycoavidus cysteinexigens]
MKTLNLAADVAIQRHVKIKAEANPFDPAWEPYFESRYGQKMRENLAGYKKLLRLWLDQNRRCCMCHQLLTKATGWHIHHIVRRVDGGNDASRNLVMVHPNCHMQIHSLGLKVTKPAPETGL